MLVRADVTVHEYDREPVENRSTSLGGWLRRSARQPAAPVQAPQVRAENSAQSFTTLGSSGARTALQTATAASGFDGDLDMDVDIDLIDNLVAAHQNTPSRASSSAADSGAPVPQSHVGASVVPPNSGRLVVRPRPGSTAARSGDAHTASGTNQGAETVQNHQSRRLEHPSTPATHLHVQLASSAAAPSALASEKRPLQRLRLRTRGSIQSDSQASSTPMGTGGHGRFGSDLKPARTPQHRSHTLPPPTPTSSLQDSFKSEAASASHTGQRAGSSESLQPPPQGRSGRGGSGDGIDLSDDDSSFERLMLDIESVTPSAATPRTSVTVSRTLGPGGIGGATLRPGSAAGQNIPQSDSQTNSSSQESRSRSGEAQQQLHQHQQQRPQPDGQKQRRDTALAALQNSLERQVEAKGVQLTREPHRVADILAELTELNRRLTECKGQRSALAAELAAGAASASSADRDTGSLPQASPTGSVTAGSAVVDVSGMDSPSSVVEVVHTSVSSRGSSLASGRDRRNPSSPTSRLATGQTSSSTGGWRSALQRPPSGSGPGDPRRLSTGTTFSTPAGRSGVSRSGMSPSSTTIGSAAGLAGSDPPRGRHRRVRSPSPTDDDIEAMEEAAADDGDRFADADVPPWELDAASTPRNPPPAVPAAQGTGSSNSRPPASISAHTPATTPSFTPPTEPQHQNQSSGRNVTDYASEAPYQPPPRPPPGQEQSFASRGMSNTTSSSLNTSTSSVRALIPSNTSNPNTPQYGSGQMGHETDNSGVDDDMIEILPVSPNLFVASGSSASGSRPAPYSSSATSSSYPQPNPNYASGNASYSTNSSSNSNNNNNNIGFTSNAGTTSAVRALGSGPAPVSSGQASGAARGRVGGANLQHLSPKMQELARTAQRTFGHRKFREGQLEVIEAIVAKRDVFVLMPTGGGKSLCYQLPAVCQPGLAVVVSPLIALIQDQVQSLHANEVNAVYLNSAQSDEERQAAMDQLYSTDMRVKLLYVTPEKICASESFRRLLGRLNDRGLVSMYVLVLATPLTAHHPLLVQYTIPTPA